MKKLQTIVFAASPMERNYPIQHNPYVDFVSSKGSYRHIVRGRVHRVFSNPLYAEASKLFCNGDNKLSTGDKLLFNGAEYIVTYVGGWVGDNRDIEIQNHYENNDDIPDYELHCKWLNALMENRRLKQEIKNLKAKATKKINEEKRQKDKIEEAFSSAIDTLEL